jgi:hypothetical protein
MKVLTAKLAATFALCLFLVACAQTGPPLPPSLELPKPPTDLRATRKGNTVILTWSEPALTTDRHTARYVGPTLVCRTSQPEMAECGNSLAMLPPPAATLQQAPRKSPQNPAPLPPQTYTDTLPPGIQGDNPDADLTYAVEVLNRNARGAGLSNRVRVPAIATLPAPADLSVQLNEDGVDLTWTSVAAPPTRQGLEFRYRIYRNNEIAGNKAAGKSGNKEDKHKTTIVAELPVGPAGPAHFLDAIEWENTYRYWITTVTVISRAEGQVQVEGDDSNAVQVVAHDVFPPAVPEGLQAVYSGEGQKQFIDLIWAPVASADLAGYNIYRREGDSDLVKLNSELVRTPSYRDAAVSSGKTYTYSVSAVDVRNNESKRSEEARESVP